MDDPIYQELAEARAWVLDTHAFIASVTADIEALPEAGPWEYPA